MSVAALNFPDFIEDVRKNNSKYEPKFDSLANAYLEFKDLSIEKFNRCYSPIY